MPQKEFEEVICMKKYLIIGIICLLILAITVFVVLSANSDFHKKEELMKEELAMVNLQLHGRYMVDTSGIREMEGITDGTPFTFFVQIKNLNNVQEYFAREYGLEFPDIDFNYENSYMAVTFGREIKELTYNGYLGEPFSPNTFPKKVELTFAEEYHDEIMYVYVMDKITISLIPLNGVSSDEQCKIYLMENGEKMFWGDTIGDINKRAPSGGPGF